MCTIQKECAGKNRYYNLTYLPPATRMIKTRQDKTAGNRKATARKRKLRRTFCLHTLKVVEGRQYKKNFAAELTKLTPPPT